MSLLSKFFSVTPNKIAIDIGLWILRTGIGLLMMPHGWKKLEAFNEKAEGFYDFMDTGGRVSMGLAIFAEFFCSILLILGLCTRLALIPLIITMSVVVFVINWTHPLGDKESALLYLIPYVVLFLTGPGRYSFDYLLFRKKLV
jgi:putative oxidoreductase